MVTDDSWTLIDWYRQYEQGVLLKGGGLLDQPNFYLEAMIFLKRRGL
jgi:hypothetical protein